MTDKTTRRLRQYGALPLLRGEASAPRVLLITSRGSGEWIIPKGWPIARLSPAESAAREAFEEAGVLGEIVGKDPIGAYEYAKRAAGRRGVPIEVDVYLLDVRTQRNRWPERGQRALRWCDPLEAAGLIAEPGLARLLAEIAPRLSVAPWPSTAA